MSTLLLSVFALLISIEDLRKFKISNRLLGLLFLMLITKSLVMGTFFVDAFSGVIFLLIFSTVHLLGKFVSPDLAIGFGDVKLISVLTFGYVDLGFRSLEISFIALWLALLVQISLEYMFRRKFLSRIAMAPSIFLATALYLWAPLGLLLPQ
jgi:Flp pilus assembly protein protease CpaA